MSVRTALVPTVSLLLLLSSQDALAQHFGRNKVEYVDFDFNVLDTEHFAIYYYPAEERGARIVARLAERWYSRLSRVLEHELSGRQPLILYGSQPEFAQTNVVDGLLGEGIGGVTESAKRRIVMPFAPTLAETDHILGHELTHAFQFDMARQYRGGLSWPLWSVEGLAQYLAFGASDGETAMWLRDAAQTGLLPEEEKKAARLFSPYRYGHAMWAYLAGRFGDDVIPRILKAKESSSLNRRIETVTGLELDALFADWREAAHAAFGQPEHPAGKAPRPPNGRVNLGPSLSPDGSQVVFFSEKSRLSLDLFVAQTADSTIVRKLATTAAAVRYESLQAIRSTGSWSPEGDQFVFAAIERGQPALLLLDMQDQGRTREIGLPQFGQILSPSWSPDGRRIAFAGLEGGISDLYIYEIASGQTRRLTDDAYSDLQPEWSPDGRRLAFVTDRYSTDLDSLRFGVHELAEVDVASAGIRPLPAITGARHVSPQWSPDGASLYFVSDPQGVSNVYRVALDSGNVYQITQVTGGVAGLTSTSPALSVARSAPVLAFTAYERGQYQLVVRRGAEALEGTVLHEQIAGGRRADGGRRTRFDLLPPVERAGDVVEEALGDSDSGLPAAGELTPRAYDPDMFLEAIGPPYLSSGGGPFGTFVRGGGSFLFSDLLGERKLALSAQGGNRLRDLAVRLAFINRERRLNWGGIAEVLPSLRRMPRTLSTTIEGEPAVTRQTIYFDRTQFRLAGLLAYPLNRAQRIEFEAGARHTVFRTRIASTGRSTVDGRLLSRTIVDGSGGAPATVGELTAAYVHDTAVFGPTSPILGARSRFEVTSTFGDLSTARVLLDHRRYLMPFRPYTVAMRVMHMGQYGADADDVRLLPAFLGSRHFVRGYDWSSVRCLPTPDNMCGALEELLGRRLLVGNVELRAPLFGMRSRDLRYGPVPIEGFLFADSGLVWARTPSPSSVSAGVKSVSSFGAGVRVNAFGFPLELSVVRALDEPSRGWSFDFTFRPGF